MADDKILFNDLLSRLDTLHDFCDPSASRNKDPTLNKAQQSIEFADVFKKEILNAMEKESNISDISKAKLSRNFNNIIENYITNKPMVSFYKNDFANLIDRTKNGLTLISTLRTTDKETYEKTSSRVSAFEPSVVAFYEFLFNIGFQKEKSIGKFISNKYLPIFDFVNGEYKYAVIQGDGLSKYTKYTFPGGKNYLTNEPKINSYIEKCVENKEAIVSFILGKIDDDEKGDIFLNGDSDVSGFYKFTGNIPNKKKRTATDTKNFQDLYFKYLSDFRKILGKYYSKDDNIMFNLIVDTTNISFSKYYKELTVEQKSQLKIKVLCNVAMNWDGANSPECQPRIQGQTSNKFGELNIRHNKSDKTTRSIFDLEYIELDQIGQSTSYKFDKDTVPYSTIKPIPREVGQISECIRQQVSKTTKNKRKITPECAPFTNKGRLLDLKRTGDALQALMAKKLNEEDVTKPEFYVFVTLDHLAFLKARVNGIPTLYTALQKDGDIYNRIIVLFNSEFSKNYKVIASQLSTEIELFEQISTRLQESFPIIIITDNKEFIKEAYFRFYLMIDYLCRIMFGIVVFIRPQTIENGLKLINSVIKNPESFNDDFDKTPNEQNTIILTYLKALLSENYNLLNKFQDKWKFQYYNPFIKTCFLTELRVNLIEITTLIQTLNAKISNAKLILNNKVIQEKLTKNIPLLDIPEEHGLINENKINENLDKFILNSFVIECFYTIKRSGIFKQYLSDIKKINTDEMQKIVPILQTESSTPVDPKISSAALDHLETLRVLNKKYQCFTAASGTDITISVDGTTVQTSDNTDILVKFFEDYKYQANSEDVKIYLNKLFGFKFEEYKIIIDRLKREIQTLFDKDIYPKIDNWLKKFEKPDFFVDPLRPSRNSLKVQDKIKECLDFFNPNTYDKNVQELLYTKVYNTCETFYKNKIAELHIINISSKPIPFEKAIDKITKDEILMRGGNTINNVIIKDSTQTQDDQSQIGGGLDQTSIKNLTTLLDCDLLYEDETYDGVIGWNDDCSSRLNNLNAYRNIYKKYKYFIINIYNTIEGIHYTPIITSIPQNTYDEWKLPEDTKKWTSSADMRVMISYIIRYIEDSPTKEKLKIGSTDYRLFIFNLFSELLKQVVNRFYDAIKDYYRGPTTFPLKGNNSIYDTIVWIMINDPSMLLYHPSRTSEWDNIEDNIIAVLGNKELLNGAGPGVKRPHTVIETTLGYDSDSDSDTEETMQFNPRQPFIKVKRQPLAIRSDVRPDVTPFSKTNIRDDDIDEYEDTTDIFKLYSPEELDETIIETKRPRFETDEDLKFMTQDEYIYMKCMFDSKFLLKTNLGILASIDTNDITDGEFKFRNIDVYNPSVIASRPILPGGMDPHPFTEDNLVGGETRKKSNNNENKFTKLSDYHKKYYKQYYNLYYT